MRFSTADGGPFFPVLFLSEKGRIFLDSEGVGKNIGKERSIFFPTPSESGKIRRSIINFIEDLFFPVLFPESPQIPKESEGTAVLPIPKESERRAKEKSKIFLFTVCRRKSQAIFDGRRGSFFSDSRFFFLCPCGAEGIKSCLSFRFLRNRKNGRPLRFLWNLRGPGVEKKGRIFPDSFGVGENIRKRTDFSRLLALFSRREKRANFLLFRYFPRLRRSSGKSRPFSDRKRTRNSKKYRSRGKYRKKDRRFFFRCPPKIL